MSTTEHDQPTAEDPTAVEPDEHGDGIVSPDHGAGAATESSDDQPGADDQHPGRALAARGPVGAPMPPPRRTGVFLDPNDLRHHVGELLRATLGGYEVDAAGNYTFVHETARIFITFGASPIGPTVGVFSITNLDVDFTEELAGFLLTTNHQMAFGAFSYDPPNRAVWLKHTLLGTMLDGPELQATLMAVAGTAAEVDSLIQGRFGGRRFHDAPADVQQRARPPAQDEVDQVNASGYL